MRLLSRTTHPLSGVSIFQAVLLAATCPASAAPISWSTPKPVSAGIGNSSDVSTNGTLVEAFNTATTGTNPGVNVTVNGVVFVTTQNLLPSDGTANIDLSSATNSGDPSYDQLLSSVDFGGGDSTTITIGDGDGNSKTLVIRVGPVPPNFLFIITDDQDTYSVGAYRRTEPAEPGPNGQPYVVDTPNIDRLADEGMLFHQARIMGSWIGAVCTASRTSLQTGRGTWRARQDFDGAGSAANTLPGVFNRGVRSGLPGLPYATYRTCKTGNSYPRANNEYTVVNDSTKRGNTNSNGSEWHADRSIDHINHWRTNHQAAGKPFLMFLGFSHPHDVRNVRDAANPPNLAGRYNAVNSSDPANIALNPQAPPLPFNFLSCTPATYPAFPFNHGHLNVRDEIQVPGVLNFRTEAVVRNEIGRNLACVDWIDRQLGRVLAKLKDPDGDDDTSDSLLDNTYIVFTADHGIAVGRHGLMGKQNLYDHSWRVPYIVRGPGIAPGSRTNALGYLHDTFPTFCDLAGLDLPPNIGPNDGRSFREVLEGGSTSAHETLYDVYAGGDLPGIRAVTDGRFKLVKYDVASNAVQVTQLFDLEQNPFELLPEHGVPNLATRTAHSGNGDEVPTFSNSVPTETDDVLGEPNTLSPDFRSDRLTYLQVPNAPRLSFGSNPFTLEARMKLRSLPTGANAASTLPNPTNHPGAKRLRHAHFRVERSVPLRHPVFARPLTRRMDHRALVRSRRHRCRHHHRGRSAIARRRSRVLPDRLSQPCGMTASSHRSGSRSTDLAT